ncbi:MAG: germination protein YpeB [Clostridia bacterium]|nr:germination protein YpeB [Clostridia bacterium]
MSEKTRSTIERYVIPAVLAVALVVVSWWGMQQKASAADYKNTTESMYRRAYGDLSDNLYDMESTLAKLLAVNTPAQRILLLDEVWRLSGSAVSSMSQIPLSHVDTEQLNQFVVRVGDYAHALTKKAIQGVDVSDQDAKSLTELRDACRKLAEQTAQRLESGSIPLAAMTADGYYTQTEDPAGAGDNAQNNEGISEFPTLIYDGPFSESAEKVQPRGLSGQEVSEEQAKQIAEGIAGTGMNADGLSETSIPAYGFSYSDETGAWTEVQVTKQGGKLLWYMKPASGNAEGKPEQSEAARYRDTALKKLQELGYAGMKATYAQYYGGAALINCAATQGNVILYSDLVKVWVDRETLEVIGLDARNYLFSHVERQLGEPAIPLEEAEAKISPKLEIGSREMALIPITPETEKLCYEFKCTLGEDSYIIYINAQDGSEEQVFRIIDSEDGTLVI